MDGAYSGIGAEVLLIDMSQMDGVNKPSVIFKDQNYDFCKSVFWYALVELGMDDYLNEYYKDPSIGTDRVFEVSPEASIVMDETTEALTPPRYLEDKDYETRYKGKSITFESFDGLPIPVTIKEVITTQTVSCPAYTLNAGTSSVRPLLTLDQDMIAYTGTTKPTFQSSSSLNQSVPTVSGNFSYLTINDSDLGIALNSGDANVSGNKLKIDRNNTVSIPVSLSGSTSGTRYVSAVGTTNSGEKYSVLGQVNGSTGNIDLDISNLQNYQTARTLTVTLYQEVDEGTNTTYRGGGTEITLEFNADPITGITFTPNYPNGQSSWTEGDSGIDVAGAKTGTLTFSGGTSGVNDPVSGKDYQKWEIVDASGNVTTDTNFSITGNELKAKKRVPAGTYTLKVKVTDNANQTFMDTITITVTDLPQPTLNFDPVSTSFTYGDAVTKVNNKIGTFRLEYPAGNSPTTITIKTIQLGSSSDDAHFSVDTSGNLKVKGTDLDAGTYNITVTGTDGNDVAFNKTVSITVNKKDQNNYQITNQSNYSLQVNKEIMITTTGNESGESETYTITSGNQFAQISNVTKFKMLDSGTFTLEATVSGNKNYNEKTVSKQITISPLPTQNPPVSITSTDSMTYGDTYTATYSGGQGSGAVSWSIENDNGTGASVNGSTVKVKGVGTFTLKVTKAGSSSYQESTDTKVITVNPRKTIVKPKTVTKQTGEVFKDNGVTYNPSLLAGDSAGTPVITSKYPTDQAAGMYPDGIQVSGLSNPNYEFVYEEGTLVINSTSLPNNGSGYYKVTGTKGKNNWYVSDVKISTTGKDGYDLISEDGISFQSQPLTYTNDGDQNVTFYLKNSTTGIIAKGINISFKIDQTAPSVPTLTMQEINTSTFATFINTLSFGNWMKQGAEVTMLSSDDTSGIDNYVYSETSKSGTVSKTSLSGIVTYQKDIELTIKAKACDKAGNCSEESSGDALMIDRKAPTIDGVKDQAVYKYYYLPRFVTVTDQGSGLSYAEYTKDGVMAGTLQDNVSERMDGVGEYTIRATDNAGNEETLTFEIVPLPDIDDIDGSDESKEIIDQVQGEYNEIKNKIDETEKTDIKDWIKDALDKWNDSRKKVVETDDKSAKVEGEGDTNFDPRTELIVDEISENDIPKLPKKALVVYDVYLRRGTTRIQPDGRIKVYLPYVEAAGSMGDSMGGALIDAEPIVYQIDTDNKVSQLSVQKEGNFVTFTTDHLVKYAISDESQEDNENNNCVVGKDDTINTKDDVCGLPNDKGDQPEKQPDGSVNVPDGGKVEFPNGIEIDTPDGAIIHPDGSVTLPDGTEYDPNGNKKDDKKQCELDGKEINIDTNGDGKPDLNIDIDGDCKADLNIDTDGDKIPDINIDTDLDGKPDYNIDTDDDGKADVNIGPVNDPWNANVCKTVNGIYYCTDSYKKPYLNIDSDNDGRPDINIDLDNDMKADLNIDVDGDLIPDIDIDSDGDGKPDINIDTDHDGKADKNIVKITEWKPDKNVDGKIKYDTMSNIRLNNSGSDGNGDNNGQNNSNMGGILGSAQTGDEHHPFLWWILVVINMIIIAFSYRKVRKEKQQQL